LTVPTFLGGAGVTSLTTSKTPLIIDHAESIKKTILDNRQESVNRVTNHVIEVVEGRSKSECLALYNKKRLVQKKINMIQDSLIDKVQHNTTPDIPQVIKGLQIPIPHEPAAMVKGSEKLTIDCIISATESAKEINKAKEMVPKHARQTVCDGSELFKLYGEQYKARNILTTEKYPNLLEYQKDEPFISFCVDQNQLVCESVQFAIVCAETAHTADSLTLCQLMINSI
jgi:hypothetical protein